MTRVSFDSTKKPLEELLRQAHAGVIQLPDFQRSWVWKDEGLRALLASVSRSFPVGTLMTLQTGGEVDFKPRLIEGAPNSASKPDWLVLDGQQRITSLYQLTLRQEVVETRDQKKQPIRRWYYIDMKAALDPNADRESAIVGVRGEDRKEWRNFEVVRDLSTPSSNTSTACSRPTASFHPTLGKRPTASTGTTRVKRWPSGSNFRTRCWRPSNSINAGDCSGQIDLA